jgi:hypothetical protein
MMSLCLKFRRRKKETNVGRIKLVPKTKRFGTQKKVVRIFINTTPPLLLKNCGLTFCWKCIKTTAAVAFASSSAAAKRFHSGGSLFVSSAAPEIVVCPECRVSISLNPVKLCCELIPPSLSSSSSTSSPLCSIINI